MKENQLFENMSQNEMALKLLEIANKKLLVKRTVYRYKNNPFYSTVFNEEDVTSELNNTVFKTITIFEKYKATKALVSKRENILKKIKKSDVSKIELIIETFNSSKEMLSEGNHPSLEMVYKEASAKMFEGLKKSKSLFKTLNCQNVDELISMWTASNGELNLDSEAYLTGYLITAFTNNISKIYGKHQTDKRSFTDMVYLDSYNEDTDESAFVKNKMEAHTAVDPLKEKEYNSIIVDMAKYLKAYDKRQNQINQNQKSQLSKLFCAIVNPKKVEDNEELRERFGWSQYLLNKNKELLMEKIREEFMDCQEEIIGYLDNRESKNKAVN